MPQGPGDGNLHITFLRMGTGDCTLITCPNGKRVMIDCGSDRYEEDELEEDDDDKDDDDDDDTPPTNEEIQRQKIHDAIFSKDFLDGGTHDLDLLILTHTDTDHRNKFNVFFNQKSQRGYRGIQPHIKKIYHSAVFRAYHPASTLLGGIVNNDAHIKRVSFRKDAKGKPAGIKISPYPSDRPNLEQNALILEDLPDGEEPDYENHEYVTEHRDLRILDGTVDGQAECYISILASEVEEYLQAALGTVFCNADEPWTSSPANSGSVVTLITFGDHKIIVCGDATRHTEKYLYDRYLENQLIANVTLVRVGHHGSFVTSSAQAFVTHISPQIAVVSSHKKETTHRVPSRVVLDRWKAQLEEEDDHHLLYYWGKPPSKSDEDEIPISRVLTTATDLYLSKTYKEGIWVTGSESDHITYDFPG